MQDDDLFASEMSGVTPLKREPRERLVKTEAVDVSQRRQAATQSGARSDNHLSDDGVPPLTPGTYSSLSGRAFKTVFTAS